MTPHGHILPHIVINSGHVERLAERFDGSRILAENEGMISPNGTNSSTADSFAASVGRAIRVARTERGWSGKDLARRAGISYSYVSHIEGGRKHPSSPVLVRIAEALGLSPSDLLLRAETSSSVAASSRAGESLNRGGKGAPEPLDAGNSERQLAEVRELMNRMSPGDRERLLDLARRLAH
jgi:transcriptional regulator with XRE-family HTH domain